MDNLILIFNGDTINKSTAINATNIYGGLTKTLNLGDLTVMANLISITTPQEKQCTKCGESFPITSEFWYVQKSNKDGFNKKCKECVKSIQRKYFAKNKEQISAKMKTDYKKNKASLIVKARNYRKSNKEKIRIADLERYNANPKKRKLSNKKSYNLPVKYKTYKQQLSYAEEVKPSVDGFLMVKCAYCGKFFTPIRSQVRSRINALIGNSDGSHRLYCSDGCKDSCPTYHKIKWQKGYKKATSREANPTLRQIVMERDNWTCQKCGANGDGVTLHCHHISPATQNPMTANDPENCKTLCKNCHKIIHKTPGCKYNELRCGSKIKGGK